MCLLWLSKINFCVYFFFQAREAYLRRYNLKENYDDTFTSVLGLHFEVAKHHFVQGEMILKCTSSLLSVYWQSSEVSVEFDGVDYNLDAVSKMHKLHKITIFFKKSSSKLIDSKSNLWTLFAHFNFLQKVCILEKCIKVKDALKLLKMQGLHKV